MRRILVISGPSGVGKTTICDLIRRRYEQFELLVSTTTRHPRDGEVDGVDYHFITKEQFDGMLEEGKFLEYANIYNNYYGVEIGKINQILAKGKSAILNISYHGLLNLLQNNYFSKMIVSIFILPPSVKALRERMACRNAMDVEVRIAEAEIEMQYSSRYDYAIVNDNLSESIIGVNEIIDKYFHYV